ncbi:MAG: tyrosine protein kinase, partial [Hungatella sp.]
PLGSVIDSAIIAQECDGMVLVIAQNATSHKFAQRVMEQLEKTECPILGAILNKVDNSNRYYGGYGRYGGYGKYGKYGEY